jgi:hypothetical protein
MWLIPDETKLVSENVSDIWQDELVSENVAGIWRNELVRENATDTWRDERHRPASMTSASTESWD